MPWSAEDMARKGAKQPAKAAGLANSYRAYCLKKGGSEKVCDARAIRFALGRTNK